MADEQLDKYEHAEYRRYDNDDYQNYLYPIFRDDFLIFTKGSKKGLLYNEKMVLDAQYDDISGFDFYFKGKVSDEEGNEIKPHCVILKKNGLYGMFALDSDDSIDGKCIIEPIFDSIDYSSGLYTFIAKKGGKSLLLRDTGYVIGKDLFDDIIQDPKRTSLYILRNKGKEGFFYFGNYVAPIYKEVQTVLLEHYVADNVLRKNDGEILFNGSGQYKYVRRLVLGDVLYGDKVFVFKDADDYIFVDGCGSRYDAARTNTDDYLLEIYGTLFVFYPSDERFQIVETKDDEEYDNEEEYSSSQDFEETD